MPEYAAHEANRAAARNRTAALWRSVKCAGTAALLALGLVFFAAPVRAEDGLPNWTVSQVSGAAMARTRADAPWAAPRVNDVFGPAAEFETGADGMLVLTHQGTTMTVSPGSRLALPSAEATASGMYRIMQAVGTVLYHVKERVSAMSHFEVETPFLAAVVKGTTFNVNASDAGGYVHVVEGTVGVQSMLDNGEVTVTGGQTARTGAKPGSPLKVIEESGSESPANPKDSSKGSDQSQNDSETSHNNSGTTVIVADAGNEVSVEKRHPGAVPIFVAGSGDGIFAKGVTIDSAFGDDSSKGSGNGNSRKNNDDVALLAVMDKSNGNGNGGNGNGNSNGNNSSNTTSAGNGNANGAANGNALSAGGGNAGGNGVGNANGSANGNNAGGNGVGNANGLANGNPVASRSPSPPIKIGIACRTGAAFPPPSAA